MINILFSINERLMADNSKDDCNHERVVKSSFSRLFFLFFLHVGSSLKKVFGGGENHYTPPKSLFKKC